MPSADKLTLAEARKQDKLDQFIAEHKTDAGGDGGTFDATLSAMARTSKSEPGTSKPGCSDD